MYLKRSKVPRKWPLPRKGTKYLVRPTESVNKGMPVLIIIRDVLGLAQNRKEVNKLINSGKIKINKRKIKKANQTLKLFDVLGLADRNYKLVLEDKKFRIKKVKGKDSKQKVAKVVGKKMLKGGKQQLNLSDGRNYLTNKKCKIGDSSLIDLEKSKIGKIIELKEGNKVLFTSGSHASQEGKIDKINDKIIVNIDDEKVETDKDSIIVIGE